MTYSILLLYACAAYLLGSVPSSVWYGKIFLKKDIRNFGSGNAGAANTFRTFGVKAGIIVLLLDSLKGWAAVKLAVFNPFWLEGTNPYISYYIFLGACAVIGHIFPVFAGFRGGKGVATLLGVVIAIEPSAAGLAMLVFLCVLLISRIASVSSMSGGISFPIFIFAAFEDPAPALKIFSVIIALLLLLTHKKNIKRLFNGSEPRANLWFWKKKKNQ